MGSANRKFSSSKDLYNEYVLLIKDCEAYLFLDSPIAIPANRYVRYDFLFRQIKE